MQLRQVQALLRRLKRALASNRVVFTLKARQEADEDLGWLERDMLSVLALLTVDDFERRESSSAVRGEIVWTFTPALDWPTDSLWIRLVEREGIVVISFHRR